MNHNLGQCGLRLNRRSDDPMEVFDRLSAPVRHWPVHTALPISLVFVDHIRHKSQAVDLPDDEVLLPQSQIEACPLARDRQSTVFTLNSMS